MQTKCCKISSRVVLALIDMRKLCKAIRSRRNFKDFSMDIIAFGEMKNGGNITTHFSVKHGMNIIPLDRSSQNFIIALEI